MRTKTVPSRWLRREGRRLDVGPYLSGALEAKVRLEELSARKDRLDEVTLDLVNAGRIKRIWVEDEEHGVRFLSSTDILQADLSNLRLIANKAVQQNPKLIIHKGWTLITRAGSIGRMAYARPDMEGMACTEDVLRVVPDPEKVPPGYLYAYLSSKFGVPQVISGTYGAIIQHIEPHHIAGLPVPRLGKKVEERVHELVEEAAGLRSEAAVQRERAIAAITELLDWNPRVLHSLWTSVSSRKLRRRLDGFHHTRPVEAARSALTSHSSSTRLGDVVDEVFEPNRGARIKVEDPDFGVPFLSSSAVFRLDPVGDYLVSRGRTPHLERLLVHDVDLLIPRSGQLGGIIGHAVLPLPSYYDDAASEHLVRIRCRSAEDAKYLWAVFASQPGYYVAIGTAFGSSIPSLDCSLLEELCVPWLQGVARSKIVQDVAANVESLATAIEAERKAVALVEHTIEEPT